MTNDSRSPKEIEREIKEKRSDLTSNLEDLQEKFSIDTVVRQIGDQFREHGGDMGRSISSQVKANPIPLALAGIGIAWLMMGNSDKPTVQSRIADHRDDDRYGDVEQDFRRSRREQGRTFTPPTTPASQWDDGPSWSMEDDNDPSLTDRMSDGVDTMKDGAASAASTVSDGVEAAKDGAASAASLVSGKVSEAGQAIGNTAASTKSAISDGAKSVQSGLSTAASRIAEGTISLTEEGRQRVIAARRKAIQMRRSAARSVSDGADVAADFYDKQPMVVGALALAFGAALGGALPRTKTEDDLMGTHSNTMFSEAERIFEEEKSKAVSVAKSVRDEVKDIAAETKADLDIGAPGDKSAVDAVADKAKAVAGRVADKAKSKAQKENLGKPKS